MKITDEDRAWARKIIERFQASKSDEEIFYELLFCICAPQTTFKNNIRVNDDLKRYSYYNRPLQDVSLWETLKPVRFYNNKAKWVAEAKQNFPKILDFIRHWIDTKNCFEMPEDDAGARKWLVKGVRGLGMKTASHFLRNLGATDLAIIDVHILKYMGVEGKCKYEELEEQLRTEAIRHRVTLGEFDIILWKHYSKTEWLDFTH